MNVARSLLEVAAPAPASPPAPFSPAARRAALERLLTTVVECRDEFTANQQLSDDVVELMKSAGV
jgi:hypothetical protein